MKNNEISAYEYAVLADDIYKDTPGSLLAGWRRDPKFDNSNGLFAAPYVLRRKQLVVVAFRGTDQLIGVDGKQFPGIGIGAGPTGQFVDALNAFHYWRKYYDSWAVNGFSVVGHSLGGNLAALVAAYSGVLGVTFNAPQIGVFGQVVNGNLMSKSRLVHFRSNFDPVSRVVPYGKAYGKEITLNAYGLGDLVGRQRHEGLWSTHVMSYLKEAIVVHPKGELSPEEW